MNASIFPIIPRTISTCFLSNFGSKPYYARELLGVADILIFTWLKKKRWQHKRDELSCPHDLTLTA